MLTSELEAGLILGAVCALVGVLLVALAGYAVVEAVRAGQRRGTGQ